MKVALVYDRVNKWGGAERVLLALHKMFPEAPLYTSVYNKKTASWAKEFTVYTSYLQKMPFAKDHHELFPFLMPIAFERFSFDKYDLVISVTSEAAKGILTTTKTKHICYCLTPTRYLWSGYDEYFANELLKTATRPLVTYLRKWDIAAAKRPDEMVAISEEVKKRVKNYYDRPAKVIYPPVTLPTGKLSGIKNQDYFLVVSRLVPYKRIDIAIEACNMLELPLKIIGTGSEERRLRAMAGKTIEFLGHVPDEMLGKYYKESRGLLFPGLEDFGITVVEAQGYGKPVLAYGKGGAKETILDGKTGMFYHQQTAEDFAEALGKFQKARFSARDSLKQAEKFSFAVFEKQFLKIIKNVENKV